MANKSENKKKRKAPEKRIEGEQFVWFVGQAGGWCGRFVIAVCLYLEESSKVKERTELC